MGNSCWCTISKITKNTEGLLREPIQLLRVILCWVEWGSRDSDYLILCRRRYSLGLRRALVMARFFLKIPHHLVSQLHHERTAERRKLVAGRKEGRKEISASRRFLFEMGTVLLIKKTMGFSKKSWLISVTMANQKLCCFSFVSCQVGFYPPWGCQWGKEWRKGILQIFCFW